jgi:hypothetical protein
MIRRLTPARIGEDPDPSSRHMGEFRYRAWAAGPLVAGGGP